LRGASRLVRQTVGEVRVDLAFAQNAAAIGRDAIEVEGAGAIDRQERAEHSCNQDGAALMWLHRSFQDVNVGRSRLPQTSRLVDAAERIAKSAPAPGGTAELLRKLAEQAAPGEIAARTGNLAADYTGVGEVLKHRHDVGEGLVKGEDVDVHRLIESGVNAVQECVCRFMSDNVVRQAGEDERPWSVVGVLYPDRKIAEQQCLLVGAVVGVPVAQGVRVDTQPPNKLIATMVF
jgi:hypothetical protein